MVMVFILCLLLGSCTTTGPTLAPHPRAEKIDTPPKKPAELLKIVKDKKPATLEMVQLELRYINHRLSRLESELILGKSTPKDDGPEPLDLQGCDAEDGDPTGVDCD